MKHFLIILLTCVSVQASAQEQKWTLKQCVQHALENNISIQQSELDLDATEIEKLRAEGNFLPSINAGSNISENTGLSFNPVTNNAQTTTFLSITGNINLGYTLFDGLRNIRTLQRAELSKLAAEHRLDKMKDDISLLIANSYLQILANKANLAAAIAQNNVTKDQIERTKLLIEAGTLPAGDLLEIEATNASEQRNIVSLENAEVISRISLAQLLRVQDYQNFDIVDEDYKIIDSEIATKSAEEIIAAAKENRSEIQIANANLALAEKDLQIAKSAYYPTLRAFFGYDTRFTNATSFSQSINPDNPFITQQIGFVEATGESVVSQFPNTVTREVSAAPFFDQLSANDGIGYGLSLNIPILNNFSTKTNVKNSKINIERSKYQLAQAELDLESNVYQALIDMRGSLKAYEAAQKAVESQKLAYQYAKDRYDVGRTNAFDFSQSKLRYDNANIELNRTKYDYIFKLKVLELFFGIDPTELKF